MIPCPHCSTPIEGPDRNGWWECFSCGLAGPRDTLEALTKKLAGRYAHGMIAGLQQTASALRSAAESMPTGAVRIATEGLAAAVEESAERTAVRVLGEGTL